MKTNQCSHHMVIAALSVHHRELKNCCVLRAYPMFSQSNTGRTSGICWLQLREREKIELTNGCLLLGIREPEMASVFVWFYLKHRSISKQTQRTTGCGKSRNSITTGKKQEHHEFLAGNPENTVKLGLEDRTSKSLSSTKQNIPTQLSLLKEEANTGLLLGVRVLKSVPTIARFLFGFRLRPNQPWLFFSKTSTVPCLNFHLC